MKTISLKSINQVFLFIILASLILRFGKEFFVLIIFSGFLAMLMVPLSNRLERHRISRGWSSLISLLIILTVFTGVVMLLSNQITYFNQDLPQIKSKTEEIITNTETWVEKRFGISPDQQMATLKDQTSKTLGNIGGFFTGIISGTLSFVGNLILVLVFTFLFLLQREKYENFMIMFYKDEKREEIKKAINQISKVAQQYLAGRLISIFLLTILYVIGFSVVGLKHAVLLSIIAAVVTFIPYIGTIIGAVPPFLIAIIEGSFDLAIWVIIIVSVAHLIQNIFIEPYVVGGSIKIGAFFTIFMLIVGDVVWGIAGIILFLPLLGILKIIFENIESLRPFAYLIGDQKESSPNDTIWGRIKGIFKRN
jgi:predicted PurR-regulated permease PerM